MYPQYKDSYLCEGTDFGPHTPHTGNQRSIQSHETGLEQVGESRVLALGACQGVGRARRASSNRALEHVTKRDSPFTEKIFSINIHIHL